MLNKFKSFVISENFQKFQKFSNSQNLRKILAESPLYGGTSAISQDAQKHIYIGLRPEINIHRPTRSENRKTVHISYLYCVGVPYFSIFKQAAIYFSKLRNQIQPNGFPEPVLTQYKYVSDNYTNL